MAKSLVIAEKPSVAADIARALGKFHKEKDYYEGENYVISSAVGHLLELCLPGDLDKKRGKWSLENLPIIPRRFDLKPVEKTKPRLRLLKKLLKREDVSEVINACDAGREGELIFRYLIQNSRTRLPTRRLWLQSMTPEAIREGFETLRSDEEMQPLAQAAICRSESDWLVGINSTRAMTAFNSKGAGFQLTPVGRVQTPTLTILVKREEEIHAFKPRTFCEVHGKFSVAEGAYAARWFDPAFKKGDDPFARAERIWNRADAERIREKCLGKIGVVTEERKPGKQNPPLLYDLTTLQREANGRYGFSAKRTLQLVQRLYERHKVLTYPRTDSRHLPEDNFGPVRSIMGKFADPELAGHAAKALENDWVKPIRCVFDGGKVSDHHAIIPTGKTPGKLDEAEAKIYGLVARRLIAAFYPPALFENTTRITLVEEESFKSEGKVMKDPGWLAVYGRGAEGGKQEQILAPITNGEEATAAEIEVREDRTKPPGRFTEASLLSAMEGAGKSIEDEDLRDAMKEKGLGTPATRAAIIEKLIQDDYVARQTRELVATTKGTALVHLLSEMGVKELCSPEMTGEWEFKLNKIEHGQLGADSFMGEIRKFTNRIVDKVKSPDEGHHEEVGLTCPKCGENPIVTDLRTYRCKSEQCGYFVWKAIAGRPFEIEELGALFAGEIVGPLDGFRSSRTGRLFSAKVALDQDLKPEFQFEKREETGAATVELSEESVLEDCPVCRQGKVHDTEKAYVCENATNGANACSFRMSKRILQREITREQALKILRDGKTDLITRFISKKGRPFSAYLKLEDGGKVGFEFEPRSKPKKPRQPAKRRKA